MKGTSQPITPSKILKVIVAIALAAGVFLPNLPQAHAQTTGSTEPRILVTYGKGAVTSGTWNEHILTVDGAWAYCVQVDKHFTTGLNVNAIDPVANGIWSQDLCTRLALIDEVIWSGDFYSTSEAGKPSHRVTSNVEKYAIAQCYIWKALDDAGFSDYGWFAVAVNGDFLTGSDTDSQVRDYVNAHKNDRVGHASYYDCGSSQNVACSFGTEPAKGRIQLQKSSADEAFVEGNSSYSLEGAVYGIYETQDCAGEPVSRMTTDGTGHAESDLVAHGDYYVREITASPGFEIDDTVYPVSVVAGETATVGGDAGVVLEQPQTGGLKVSKASALKSVTQDNALYANEGAVFGIYGDAACTEELTRMTTGKQGTASAEGLPLGLKYVKEISAPAGMALNEQVYQAIVKANEITEVGGGTVFDTPKTNAVKLLLAKRDGQKEGSWETNLPQGCATLENAEFTVRYFDGFYDSAEAALNSGTLKRSWVFKTDSAGTVLLDSEHLVEGDPLYVNSLGEPCLPLGTVVIEETKPPKGYLPDTRALCAQVTDSGTDDEFLATYEAIMASDEVKRGDLEFVKASSPDMKRLAGVPFAIASQTTGECHVIVTDENGYASTASSWNPHSTNTNGNDALLTSPAQSGETDESPDESTTTETFATGAPHVNQVATGGQEGENAEGVEESQAVSGAEDENAANDAGGEADSLLDDGEDQPAPEETADPSELEAPIDLSEADDSGESEASSEAPDEQETQDGSPAGESTAGEEPKAPAAMQLDYEAGIWFGMGDDGTTSIPVDDSRGALPYDTYTITELPCPANEGLQLIEASVVISRDNHVVDLGTLDDPAASIGTQAHDGSDGDSVLPCSESVTIVDRVRFANLIPGREYTICGTLVDKETEAEIVGADGAPYTARTTFTPDSSLGSVELSFELSTTELQEHAIVVFEEVTLEGRTVATHADIDDQDQTVTVARPAVGTSASDAADGDAVVAKTAEARVVDRVSYSGVTPGVELEVQGTLMDKAANAPLLVGEQPVESSVTFTPEHASGTVDVVFSFDASALEASTQLVAFEKLVCGDTVIASHQDLQDSGQTITVMPPTIQTNLQDADTGLKNASASGTVRLTDTVSYEGLVIGREYEMVGTLMDKQTEKPVLDAQGNAITARSTFTPDESTGSITVTFEFDGSNLGGHTLVAFESLLADDRELAVHADISDEAQSVIVSTPQIHTQATVGDDAAKTIAAGPDAIVHDAVQVSGARSGAQYTVVGVLMDKSLGLPLVVKPGKDDQGETATTEGAETEKIDGTAQLWSGLLKAANVGYTVKDSGSCIELPHATDIDYQAVGKAIEAHASEAEHMALVAKTVNPQDSSFEVQMDFQVPTNGLSGQFVVFEALVDNDTGKLVAVHADFSDTDQTIEITSQPTPSKGKPQAGSDTYDKTGNVLSRYAWAFALLAAAGCASAAFGIARYRRA